MSIGLNLLNNGIDLFMCFLFCSVFPFLVYGIFPDFGSVSHIPQGLLKYVP